MSESKHKKNLIFNPDIHHINQRDVRPRSTKTKFNERNINLINAIKISFPGHENNLRYSVDKPKLNKREKKLAKFLIFSDSKKPIKIHNFFKEKTKEKEINVLSEDRLKLKNLEEKIKELKKVEEEKSKEIKNLNENNEKLKEMIKEKENKIENIKKNINDFKKMNDELTEKIENIKNSQINNDINNSHLDNSNDLSINFENSFEREEAINNLLSMMMGLPRQDYPNVDNMTYEELLELEEKIGKVSNGLTEDEIKQLKQEKFIKYKYLEEKCIVCQYDFKELENIVVLPCKHCFHFPCIKPWISNQHHCPLCKKNIRNEDK